MSKKTETNSQPHMKTAGKTGKTLLPRISMEGSVIQFSSPKMTARATLHVTDHAQSYGLQQLHDRELKSIYALFSWVANQQKAAHETVQCMTEARFGVKNVTQLQQKDYEDVIRFLVDLRIDEMKN